MTETETQADVEKGRAVELVGGPLCGHSVSYDGKGHAYLVNWRGRTYTYLLEPGGKTAFIKTP